MPAVTPSSNNIQVEPAALPADGADTAAAAAGVGARVGAAGGGSMGTIATGAGPDAVSAAITAAMSPWPAEMAKAVATLTAQANETASTDSAAATTIEIQDEQNAAGIAAAAELGPTVAV